MSDDVTVIEDENKEEYDIFGEFEDIFRASMVNEEKFRKGLKFASYLVQYRDKSKAYNKVYGYHERCANLSTQLINTRWMTMVLDRMSESQYALFLDKRMQVIDEAFVESTEGSGRNKLEAMKLFLEHTKKPDTLKVEVEHTHEIGNELKERIDNTLKLLSGEGKLLLPDGEITDAELVLE